MKWKFVIGLALSAVFLWLAFRQARLGEVAAALASARYAVMIPTLVFTLAAFAVRAYRWHFLLAPVQKIPFRPLFSSTMIGFMGNNVLPARLGELLRAHSLGHSTGVSRSSVLASIVLERILDIFVLLILLGAILVLHPLKGQIQGWGAALLIAVLPILTLLLLYRSRPGPVLRVLLPLVPKRLRPQVEAMAANFHEGLRVLGRRRTLLWAFVCSLVMWACLAAVVVLCLAAVHLALPADAGLVVMVVMAIGTMIPSAPGYIGTLQYAGTLALLQYGVDRSVALSFTLLYHASQWIPVTLGGLFYFVREQMAAGRRPVPGRLTRELVEEASLEEEPAPRGADRNPG